MENRFDPTRPPSAKVPGGTYQDEPAEWAARVFSWASEVETAEGLLIDVARALQLVEEHMSADENEGGALSLSLDRLREVRGDLGKLKGEIYLFASAAKGEPLPAEPVNVEEDGNGVLASFADAVENYRKADAAAHQDGNEEDQAAWDAWGEAFDAAMHYPTTTADELRAKVDLFTAHHLADRFAENMSEHVCDQIRAVFSDALRLAEQSAPVNYDLLQDRIAKLEAVAAKPGLECAYRLICDLDRPLTDIRNVRHSLLGLSMSSLEDWQAGSIALAFRELERALDAIEDLTDPIAIDWRKADGLKPEGGLPDQEDA